MITYIVTITRTVLVLCFVGSYCLATDVPSVSADLGACSASFEVTDGNKPIYNAKIRTRIKHGAFGARKLDLEVGTDANGHAMVTALPEFAKRPISFEVSSGEVSRTVLFEPEKQCKAQYNVQLRKAGAKAPSNPQP